MSSQEKKVRFEPNHEGLNAFLKEFKQIWEILTLLERGPIGQTPEIQGFTKRKFQITRFADLILRDKLDTFVRTITSGCNLMDNIQDYIENLVEINRVSSYFDTAFAKLEEISHDTWNEECDRLNKLYALFVQNDQGEDSDLHEVVLAYNNLVSGFNRATSRALAAKKAKEEATQHALEARKKRERMERTKASSMEILAQLG